MADKNLQLDSRFSIIGAFWQPEAPGTILKGTLVSDKREINFITAPEYERPISLGPGMFAMPDSTMIREFSAGVRKRAGPRLPEPLRQQKLATA